MSPPGPGDCLLELAGSPLGRSGAVCCPLASRTGPVTRDGYYAPHAPVAYGSPVQCRPCLPGKRGGDACEETAAHGNDCLRACLVVSVVDPARTHPASPAAGAP